MEKKRKKKVIAVFPASTSSQHHLRSVFEAWVAVCGGLQDCHHTAMQRVVMRASRTCQWFSLFRPPHIGAALKLYLSRVQFHASWVDKPTSGKRRRVIDYDHVCQTVLQLGRISGRCPVGGSRHFEGAGGQSEREPCLLASDFYLLRSGGTGVGYLQDLDIQYFAFHLDRDILHLDRDIPSRTVVDIPNRDYVDIPNRDDVDDGVGWVLLFIYSLASSMTVLEVYA